MDGMTPELWAELERVANGTDSGLDLRFDRGDFLAWLDALVDMGLVDFEQGDPDYFVSYTITPEGAALLEEHRKSHPPQE